MSYICGIFNSYDIVKISLLTMAKRFSKAFLCLAVWEIKLWAQVYLGTQERYLQIQIFAQNIEYFLLENEKI